MSNEQQRPDMRHLWQGQVVEEGSMTLHELHNALAKLNRVERLRMLAGGLCCLLFLGACGALLVMAAPNLIVRSFECFFAIFAGLFFFQFMLGIRRARGKWLSQAEPQACAAFYRSVLERQRKFYRRAALWFPLLISASLLPVVLALPPLRVITITLWIVLVAFWVYESVEIARRSQRELDKLNASWR